LVYLSLITYTIEIVLSVTGLSDKNVVKRSPFASFL